MKPTEVLVVGAGPTGLILALWLTRQGVPVRIIDQRAGPGEASRAMAVQARTLELYRQLDLADAVVAAGYRNPTLNLWAKGEHRARVVLGDAGADVSPYPFILMYPQDHHERLLVERLAALGVTVERQTTLLAFEDTGDQVQVRLRMPDGREETSAALYLAGCDGARSTVRKQLGSGFKGGTYRHVFYVADVRLENLDPPNEGHIAFDHADFLIVLPYGNGQHRLVGIIRDEEIDGNDGENAADTLTFDDVSHRAILGLGVRVDAVNWFSTYRVHHRVADRFHQGRAFLLGDAAHVHSPVGGQGMNTGIVDAINLAWKLAAVVKGQAPEALLDSYAQERQAFAQQLVETTDRLFSFVTAEGSFADYVRTHIAPLFASIAYRIDAVREFMFRLVSQTTMSYEHSVLSEGRAGSVRGGQRLPWVPDAAHDNYGPLRAIAWQVHVYGAARPELRAWCAQQRLPLHEFAWHPAHERVGFARDAAYLLRPDTYVALADADGSPQALERYFDARGITPGRSDGAG